MFSARAPVSSSSAAMLLPLCLDQSYEINYNSQSLLLCRTSLVCMNYEYVIILYCFRGKFDTASQVISSPGLHHHFIHMPIAPRRSRRN